MQEAGGGVEELVAVGVGERDGVGEGVAEVVTVGDTEGVAEGVGVGLKVGVAVEVGLAEVVGVGVSEGEGVFDGEGEGGMQETSVAAPAPPVNPTAPPPIGTFAPAEAPKVVFM